ncbi:hypothetical protein GAH_00908 [Geoglobus ahangari]|uniref:Uncharacterized protein n=1 Tax=Geoglobus ahangari TaxID=113653 RepID=A0A0F7IE42_9EURY|nr:hypothetical protein [Geoglobus ahangari]AKG91764.1 hypothetical protein GAH_00908 [Geoglobus ahangari]
MYFEIWIDLSRKEEVEKALRERFIEVYEAFYDYHYIVNANSESELMSIDGVKLVRRHYDC